MPKLAVGQYELKVMFSCNGQQYYNTNQKILFNAPEFGLKFEDIIKLDDLDKGKKGVKKNK
jgi:hypothetical protein